MKKDVLNLEHFDSDDNTAQYRTIFKNQHGRVLYFELKLTNGICTITNCFYLDRNQGRNSLPQYRAKPKLLRTFTFEADQLLEIIAAQLDKRFYGIQFVQSQQSGLPLNEYLNFKSNCSRKKYRFLIMIGDGEIYNGLPSHLRTRLKTKLHRAVYVELEYYKDGNGVVKECSYYDRQYKRRDVKITPPQLISCFFPYSKSGIVDMLNRELCCDFTHIIVTSGIDLDSDTTPLCGAV